ncbi:FHA domain-containing protein [Verrucomicrobiota bacterium sgz303538]
MPTLRIQFPEKDSPSTIVLDAPRITIGRRADNTIQIVDRMVSAFHAELIREDEHYRLHDLGSTNGTRVNGEFVTDYHLREGCKISFGLVEAEFSMEVTQGAPIETLPTRVEVDAVRRDNEVLRGRLDIAQNELDSLRQVREVGSDEAGTGTLREELERVIRERSELQEAARSRDREFTALKTELARMNRDRQNLQDALSQANAELATLRASAMGMPEAPATEPEPVPPAPAAEAPAEKPQAPGIAGIPKPSSVAAEETAPRPPAAAPVPVARPAAPTAVPRPVARPAAPVAPAEATGPAALKPRVVAQPAAKAGVPARANSGPSGTQKISISSEATSGASGEAKPLPRPLPRPVAPGATTGPRRIAGPPAPDAGKQG